MTEPKHPRKRTKSTKPASLEAGRLYPRQWFRKLNPLERYEDFPAEPVSCERGGMFGVMR